MYYECIEDPVIGITYPVGESVVCWKSEESKVRGDPALWGVVIEAVGENAILYEGTTGEALVPFTSGSAAYFLIVNAPNESWPDWFLDHRFRTILINDRKALFVSGIEDRSRTGPIKYSLSLEEINHVRVDPDEFFAATGRPNFCEGKQGEFDADLGVEKIEKHFLARLHENDGIFDIRQNGIDTAVSIVPRPGY